MNAGAAQAWFIAGTIVLMLAGGGHVLATLLDTVRPTFFAPIEGSVKPVMECTGSDHRRHRHGMLHRRHRALGMNTRRLARIAEGSA